MGPRAAVAGALAALALAAAPRAEAYVRYKTTSGQGFFWAQTCIPLYAYPATMIDLSGNMEMTPDQILHAAQAAASAWGSAALDGGPVCTYLKVNVTQHDEGAPAAGLDYTNGLTFRTASWCAPSDPPGTCSYAAEALAITSVFVNKRNGQIYDGDIEVNAKNFIWTDLDTDTSGRATKQDLQNALTHEMGHLIGLDHTCWVPQLPTKDDPNPQPPLDNKGNPAPDCDSAPLAVQETTMFASATPGDTAKRTLAPDDTQAICDIYPLAADPKYCPDKDPVPPKQGCALAAEAGSGAGGAALAAAGAIALVSRRRRGRRA
jgi:hypothetical protein